MNIKLKRVKAPNASIDLTGYKDVFQPTETESGETGLYVRDKVDFIERPDLAFNSAGNYESISTEIKFKVKRT